jgi:glucose-1-phosphate thymidylyltransferase
MKGIILAGGTGTRLYPNTLAVSKQLIPIYDKPMIYYPLSVLMLCGIREILIITTPEDQASFRRLLGSGEQWGIQLSYKIQEAPRGLAEAFILGESFINQEPVCLVLGDNIFYVPHFDEVFCKASQLTKGGHVFGYHVSHPEQYGVAAFDANGKVIDIIEKPATPPSRWAITGIYFYDGEVSKLAKTLVPSARGELEITDLNRLYLKRGDLEISYLPRGSAWLDTGTFDGMMDASLFVQVLEKRQGFKIACLEEIAWRKGYIDDKALTELAGKYHKSGYGKYLIDLLNHAI